MTIKFVDNLPSRANDPTKMDTDFAEKLIDALIDNPNEWAQIAYTDLYPDSAGDPEEKVIRRVRNLTQRIRKGVRPFHEYQFEATSRGLDIFVRVLVDERHLRGVS